MDSRYWDIAAKIFEGKATPAEQEALRRWLAQDPAHEVQYKSQEQLWKLTAHAAAPVPDTDAAWKQVRAKLQPSQSRQPKVIPLYSQMLRVAAAVAMVIGMAWLAKSYFFPYYGLQVVESGSKQMAVTLPDSSHVWLNKESILAYDPEFDGAVRKVHLKGEAFFEVTHNPQQPFVIKTEEAETRVLGTSFNLRAYPEAALVELTVATGKVAFAATEGSDAVVVTQGYAATLNAQHNSITRYSLTDSNAWAWKTRKLQFKGQPLREVLAALERYYSVKLQLQQPALGSCRFTGTFQDVGLREVLQVLEVSLQIKIMKIGEQTYTLAGEGCN